MENSCQTGMMMNPWHNTFAETIFLDGEWEFTLKEQHGTIQVPGTWEAQGFDRRSEGPANFRKTVTVPAGWHGKKIQLQFDAVSYYAEIQVNGEPVGTHTGMWSPFALDVSEVVRFGQANELALTVFKPGERFPVRESLAGFLPDVSIPFGGIWQSARLVAFEGAALSDISLWSDAQTGDVRVSAETHRAQGMKAVVAIFAPLPHHPTPAPLEVEEENPVIEQACEINSGTITAMLTVPQPELWQPDHPVLYMVEIRLENEQGVQARVQRIFGFRSLSHDGDQLLLNGAPICLRGLLNWGWYPDILCPAPDEATIRDEFQRVRSMGFNMVKLCLYVPSPLYLRIADEEGMLLWLELPMWLPTVTPRLRQQAPIEYADILDAVQHHPSVVIYSLGCELGKGVDADLLGPLNTILRERVSGVLACDNSGSGEAYGGLAFDYADFNDYHFYCDLHYFSPLVDHFSRDWRPARPWIFGEFCDADDYRDLGALAQAHHGELPWWLVEINPIRPLWQQDARFQKARMEALKLPFDEPTIQHISYQQSLVVRKTILEKVRGRAGMGGYVVTGLRNTPLATSSMFDDYGHPKYAAEEVKTFNADTVLVLEQGRARLWTHGGDRPFPVDLYNHTAGSEVGFRVVLAHAGRELPAGEVRWTMQAPDGTMWAEGETSPPNPLSIGWREGEEQRMRGGNPYEIASFQFRMPEVDTAQTYRLEVRLGETVANHWSLWLYPAVATWEERLYLHDPAGVLVGLDDLAQAARNVSREAVFPADGVLIASAFTLEVYRFVQNGGKAILLQTGDGNLPAEPCPFWREAIKLFYPHPVMDAFPHQGYADLQFYNLATDYALNSEQIAAEVSGVSKVTPLLRRLDARQFTVRDYLVEFQVGKGTLLASTLRFTGGAGDQVMSFRANAAGRYLMAQMIRYLMNKD